MPDLLPLKTRNLSLTIGAKMLLDNISLTLPADTLTVIMGANGAGKSVLLRVLHGLLLPSSGELHWNERAMSPAIRQRQAMIFQRPVLLRRSVGANMDFALALKHSRAKVTREQLLDDVGLLDKARMPARLLSGGEQQRLALARALGTAPDVLFLDEPTASLDPASVALLEAIVQKQQKLGTKIIFITHDIGQARRLADDVVFLHAGKLQEYAQAQAFFNQPESRAAQAYLAGQLFFLDRVQK